MVVGAYLHGAGKGAAYVYTRTDGVWGQVKKLTAPGGVKGDYFGYRVALDGDTAVVGAYESHGGSGAAYVFARNAGGTEAWGLVKNLVAGDGAADDKFGFAVAVSGDTVVVSAYFDDVGANANQGSVYVFERNQGGAGNWGQVKKLTGSDGEAFDELGYAVALDGDTLVVGADLLTVSGNLQQGAAYVYDRNAGGTENWGQVRKLSASDGASSDRFGVMVGISVDTVVVGAYADDIGASVDQGSAYVFDRNQGGTNNWGAVTKLTATDGAASDRFGWAVGINGDSIVVGAHLADVGINSDQGAAYIFLRNQGGANTWGSVAKLQASDGRVDDSFAVSVAIAGGTVVIGAFQADSVRSDQGAAYFFDRNCGNGTLDSCEQCDDGNSTSGDGCDSNCTVTACGNGIITAGEQCDDGNVIGGDCCSADCQTVEPDGSACNDGDGCPADSCQAGICQPASCPNVDAVVLSSKPVNVSIRRNKPAVAKTVAIAVRNADMVDRTIALSVDASGCPTGLAGLPDFLPKTPDPDTSILVPAGKTKKAKLRLTINSVDFESFNFKAPTRCTLLISAADVIPGGNNDPSPANNVAMLEINVVDKNDPEQTTATVHESLVKSSPPTKINIRLNKASTSKTLSARLVNSDYKPAAENPGDAITLSASTTCPGLTLGTPVCDPTTMSSSVMVKGGAAKKCKITATADAATISTINKLSPQRCTVTLTATGPTNPQVAPLDASNNTTELVIDVLDKNDY
jgi:cysteine-rich repeat protein